MNNYHDVPINGGRAPRQPAWSMVLSECYALYARHFWTYFRIAIPPVLAACAFSFFTQIVTRSLLFRGTFFPTRGSWVALAFANGWFKGAGYWTISSFFFAAIAARFSVAHAGGERPLIDAYTLPRERLGALAAIALLTWTLFFVGRTLSMLAASIILGRLGLDMNFWAMMSAVSFMLLLLSGLLAKFGLAIPELITSREISAGNALRNSLRKTAGWEVFFMIFLAKSAMLGYGIYWAANIGLDWLAEHWTLNPGSYPWVKWLVYICIAAALESPLFIAFSVLYQRLQTLPATLAAEAGADGISL
jgi:hypothetical protein